MTATPSPGPRISHIDAMSRQAFNIAYRYSPEIELDDDTTDLLLITEPDKHNEDLVLLMFKFGHVCMVHFKDTQGEHGQLACPGNDTQMLAAVPFIADFLKNARCWGNNVIVRCEQGTSRSQAVKRFAAHHMGFTSDGEFLESYNKDLYQMLCDYHTLNPGVQPPGSSNN